VVRIYVNTNDTNINAKNVEGQRFANMEDTRILAKNVAVPRYVCTIK